MKAFKNIAFLEQQLQVVNEKALAISEDKLFRQPLSEVLTAVFASPGKMIRPSLVMLFGRFGPEYSENIDRLEEAAAVIELTHLASLIHDDIVDDAPMRRSRPTIQSSFGKDMAVYAGDYLLSCVLGAVTAPSMSGVGPILARGLADMCSGEMGQYLCQFNTEVDENRYFMNISGKTAALFSSACEVGAALAGCARYTTGIASRFGHSFGILFQLRDDLNDCSAGKDDGKKQGMDFINGIYTLPVIYAFGEPEHGPALRELAQNAPLMQPEEVFRQLQNHLVDTGAIEYTRWFMKQYRERALNMLSQLPAEDVKLPLTRMLDELIEE